MKSAWAIVALLALTICTTACTAAAPPEAKQAGPAFDPIAFFTGTSHGDGRLKQIMKGVRNITVDSVGTPEADGSISLAQHIVTQGDAPRDRVWRLRQTAPGRYAGTLTDASGPVETITVGRAIRIRYPMKGGLQVEQWLVAMPNGKMLDNRLSVTKWGIHVASLHERISKR